MKLNIYKTNSKLLIVFITITVIWLVFGIMSITSINKINNFHTLKNDMNDLSNTQHELAELNQILINESDLEDQLYNTGENEVTEAFLNSTKEFISNSETLLESDYFYYNKNLSESMTEIRDQLESITDDFNALLEAMVLRGNQNAGLIAQWQSQLSVLNDMNYQINSMELSDGINQMQNLFNQYLQNSDNAPINEITMIAEGLKSVQLQADTSSMEPDAVKSNLEVALNNIISSSNQILEQDIIIGNIQESGLANTIDEQLTSVGSGLTEIEEAINSDFQKAKNRSRSVILIFWIFFIAVTITGYFLLRHWLVKPVEKIKQFAIDLSKGGFPEKIELSDNDEINEIGEHFNEFTDSLRHKADFARQLGEDKIMDNLELLGEQDMLGNSLLSMKDKLQKAKEEEEKRSVENEKRRWINEGLAKFGDILRQNNDNMEQLSSNLITELVKYLNATQGGLFLLNDDDKENIFLELKSAIAYNRQKFLDKKIELGEGMVGTCAIERKSMLLTEIPEEYLEITSGLGDANPRCLLIVPLNLEEETLGVIEVASFNEFKDYEVEFVEKISESIASTLTAVKVNERTAELLAKSQKQAAEMSEQEEEMRQNMEELQATQEEAARRENEISSILNAIDATSLVVEYDMNGYITKINDKFLSILEIPKNDIIGVHHSNFTSKARTENSYIEFWKKLQDGQSITTVEVIKLLNGKKLWLNQNYSPILNMDNQPYKIINIAIDITETKVKEQSLEKRDREIVKKTNEMEYLNTAINDAIIKCDYTQDGNIINANENYAQIIGYPIQEIMGRNISEFLSREENQIIQKIWSSIKSNGSHKEVIKRIMPNGDERFIISSFTPVTDEDGNIYKIFYLGQDITEQKLKYDLLAEANKEIERLKKLVGEE